MVYRSPKQLQVESLEKRLPLAANLVVDGNSAPVVAAQLAMVGSDVYFSTNNGTETQIRRSDGARLTTVAVHQVFSAFGEASPDFLWEVGDGVMYGLTEPFFEENIAQATYQIWYAQAGSAPQLVRELPVVNMFGAYQPPMAVARVDDSLLMLDASGRYQLIDVDGDTISSWSAPVDQQCGSPIYGAAHVDAGGVVVEASYRCGSFLTPLFVRADESSLQEVETHPGSLYLPNGTEVFTEFFRDTGALELFFKTLGGTERITASGASLKPESPTRFGDGRVFFSADDGIHGREPWITDGTEAGTQILSDISGLGSSDPEVLGQTPRGLIFSAFSESRGTELWITDGTVPGTRLLRDIRPGTGASHPQRVALAVEDQPIEVEAAVIYFWADTVSGGRELWATDGTTNGTVRLTSQVMSSDTALTAQARLSDGSAVLGFADAAGNMQVWTTNATAAGTRRISALPGRGRVVEIAASQGNNRAFAIRLESNEIWTFDALSQTAQNVLSNADNDTFGLNPQHITQIGSRILFTTDVEDKSAVWIWDPASGQLSNLGIIAMQGDITIRVLSDQTAIFTAFNSVRVLNNGKLSALGTQLLLQHESVGNHSYLLSSSNDLTIVSDARVTTRPAGKYFQLTPYAGGLYALNEAGQLVRFDGSVPTLLSNAAISTDARLLPGPVGSLWVVEDSSRIQRLQLSNARVVETLPIDEALGDPVVNDSGQLFWRSASRRTLRTIRNSSAVDLVGVGDVSSFEDMIAVGNRVFMIGVNSRLKRSLWTSDGTSAGSTRLGLIPGLRNLATDGQKLFFTGDGSLWESDGTIAGTFRSTKIQSEIINATADELEVVGTDLYFAASDGTHGQELFQVPLPPPTGRPGDTNGDGLVNFTDFLVLSRDFGVRRSPSPNDADFDDDGVVGFADFLVLASQFKS